MCVMCYIVHFYRSMAPHCYQGQQDRKAEPLSYLENEVPGQDTVPKVSKWDIQRQMMSR